MVKKHLGKLRDSLASEFNLAIKATLAEKHYDLLTDIIKQTSAPPVNTILHTIITLLDAKENKVVMKIIDSLKPDILKALQNHSDPSIGGFMPVVHNAALLNNTEILAFLIRKEFNIKIKHSGHGINNMTPLGAAIITGSKEAVSLLCKQGSHKGDKSALEAAITYGEDVSVLKILGANASDRIGAIKNKKPDIHYKLKTLIPYPESTYNSKLQCGFYKVVFGKNTDKCYSELTQFIKQTLLGYTKSVRAATTDVGGIDVTDNPKLLETYEKVVEVLHRIKFYKFPLDKSLIGLLNNTAPSVDIYAKLAYLYNQACKSMLYKSHESALYYGTKALALHTEATPLPQDMLGCIYYNLASSAKHYDFKQALDYLTESKKYLPEDQEVISEEVMLRLRLGEHDTVITIARDMPASHYREILIIATQLEGKKISAQEATGALEQLNVTGSSADYELYLEIMNKASNKVCGFMSVDSITEQCDRAISIGTKRQSLGNIMSALNILISRDNYTAGLQYLEKLYSTFPRLKEYCVTYLKYQEFILRDNTGNYETATPILAELNSFIKYGAFAAILANYAHQTRFYTEIQRGDFASAKAHLKLTSLDPSLLETLRLQAITSKLSSASAVEKEEELESDDEALVTELIRIENDAETSLSAPSLSTAIPDEVQDEDTDRYLTPQEIHTFCQNQKSALAKKYINKLTHNKSSPRIFWVVDGVKYKQESVYEFQKLGSATWYTCIKSGLLGNQLLESFTEMVAEKGAVGRPHGRSGVVMKDGIVKLKDAHKDYRPWTDKLYFVAIDSHKYYLAVMDHLDDHVGIEKKALRAHKKFIIEDVTDKVPLTLNTQDDHSEHKNSNYNAAACHNPDEPACLALGVSTEPDAD